jgi:hypothetical protein
MNPVNLEIRLNFLILNGKKMAIFYALNEAERIITAATAAATNKFRPRLPFAALSIS